jgi:hypothetical protein
LSFAWIGSRGPAASLLRRGVLARDVDQPGGDTPFILRHGYGGLRLNMIETIGHAVDADIAINRRRLCLVNKYSSPRVGIGLLTFTQE